MSSTTKCVANLVNFFIYNAEYGPKEGEEHKKILYYYPSDTDIDTKIKDVGLCEAIVKFTETFSEKPCHSIHSQKKRQLFFSPEKDFWMIMTVSIPFTTKVRDGQTYTDYHEEDIQDSIYNLVLEQSYKMFKLFMGPFTGILEKGSVQTLKQRFDHFYSRYLLTLKLNCCDILDVFNGIHFLPLDKNSYLQIQCFINLLEANFSQVKYTAFLYSDQLVWSGLEQEDMRIMYRYLTTSLFPSYLEQELQGSQTPPVSSRQAGGVSLHYGKFITGPPNLVDTANLGKVPRVFIKSDADIEECHLVVYRALSATVCLLVDSTFQLTFDFFKKIDSFLGPNLSSLASDISEQYSKRQASANETQYKYIYFNHMNLAQKTTVHAEGRKSANITIPNDTIKLLNDINADLTKKGEDGETIIKTCSDCWVVGKKSDQREFYVVINQRNANLIEINEEVKKLCANSFSNIFFLD
ncbi:vacuolar fusion protein CCZ1 homolog [Lineus longissimus]|uniref:vacuolar fusion protein CCZ1 homolog n=1 Tax=Lineus longissimus TaxID=88925 RepID=UPI002B4E40C5